MNVLARVSLLALLCLLPCCRAFSTLPTSLLVRPPPAPLALPRQVSVLELIPTSFSLAEAAESGLSSKATIGIFIVGLIPFGIATFEFWRRIAVGASFGTNEPIYIGQDDAPERSRGKQILGRDSLIAAYGIFAVSAAVLGLVLYSVISSGPMPGELG